MHVEVNVITLMASCCIITENNYIHHIQSRLSHEVWKETKLTLKNQLDIKMIITKNDSKSIHDQMSWTAENEITYYT